MEKEKEPWSSEKIEKRKIIVVFEKHTQKYKTEPSTMTFHWVLLCYHENPDDNLDSIQPPVNP